MLLYAGAMFTTNTRITLLDDESIIIAVAAHPVLPTLQLFLAGGSQHEHPPLSDILLHGWMLLTRYSFFALRIFANLFYIGSILTISGAAGKLAGSRAYWFTMLVGFTWPFALQYGRITGWNCVSMFLLSCVTFAYLEILEDRDLWPWILLGASSISLVWTNYFGVVLLVLLFTELVLFHRSLARKRAGILSAISVCVAASFLPLLKVAITVVQNEFSSENNNSGALDAMTALAYAVYSIFGSVAVAPWYWHLSVPVAIGAVLLVVSIWFGPGRRWMLYFAVSLLLLALSGHLTIKRIVFLLPWFFLAVGLTVAARSSKFPRMALAASSLLIACGLLGIASGRHYTTTNLYEPWEAVSGVVARDARQGATVVSGNPPFFLYLNYDLGLQTEMQNSDNAYLGADLYRTHGFTILEPDLGLARAQSIRGKAVIVLGPGVLEDVQALNKLNVALATRCEELGEFRAAPDPALAWKRRFTTKVDLLPYRSDVTWYDCH